MASTAGYDDGGARTRRALTVFQPWAWAIAAGIKDVENRPWGTPHRGRLLIHAGRRAKLDERGLNVLARLGVGPPAHLTFGAIIGEVELLDCVRDSTSRWAMPGAVHWLFARPRMYQEPVPCRGRQHLFASSPTGGSVSDG